MRIWITLFLLTTGLAWWLVAGEPPTKPADAKAPAQAAKVKKPAANNSRCLVCHINFEDEELAVKHAKANLGCVKCHGESKAHAADENNVTAPDTMYPKARLNAACIKCHEAKKLSSDQHQEVLAGKDPKNKYCTDCHGEHQMNNRTRKWDKETGKLLE